jgi:hypothetical protein
MQWQRSRDAKERGHSHTLAINEQPETPGLGHGRGDQICPRTRRILQVCLRKGGGFGFERKGKSAWRRAQRLCWEDFRFS